MQHLSSPYHLLLFITSGQLIYWVDNETILLQKGDVLFVPAGSVRSGIAIEYHQRYAAFFDVQGDDKNVLPILDKKQTFKLKIQNFAYFKQRYSLLNHHWMMKGAYLAATCNAILLEMLSMVNYDLDCQDMGSKKIKLVKDIYL